ncbi:hypothetical protein ASG29_10110 [Sphingomonas sp. Leaf412]|uniref:tetratricopeptide repeat protein n=1 Tax=Sphingomonas sp. Leaf412 TaxID=1736370 RepID=UPI0006FEF9D0|nr:tetratricopeptide repeat protein [Sphingomonas sp. Leaf412]KQT32183.1 hypothetical protein ASG29_10110 [Sphingomonas sp. Leaf412]
MALTPQNNEAFLREVDEELRRDQALALWKRWGRVAIVAIIVALAAFAAYLFWRHQQNVAAEREGERLQVAYDYLAAQDTAGASKPLAELAGSKHDGYRALAAFTQADILLVKNDLKGAAAKFGGIAGDTTVAQPFRDLALIRQTSAEFDTLAPDAVVNRLKPLVVPGNPWLGSAGELVAAAYLKQGRRDLAAQTFSLIARDEGVPPSLRQRAVQMASAMGVDAAVPAKGVTKQ